ncbi:isochorismate synthase [Streptomyces sp. NPDC050211]|uniref:isochorismate synthase n=1 Tax=Streptomyces sp. NPDC050211 TaxID=3154932 RepID=UPI0034183324
MSPVQDSRATGDTVRSDARAWNPADFGPQTSFVHRTPQRTLHTTGVHRAVRVGPELHGLPGRAAQLLATARRDDADASTPGTPTVIAGALPFHVDHSSELFVPRTARFSRSTDVRATAPMPSPATAWRRRSVPEPSVYAQEVRRVLDQLTPGQLDKVVLARSLHLTAPTMIDIGGLLRRLAHRDPHARTFAVRLPGDSADGHGRRMLVGASPELLVSTDGEAVVSHPLAGSAARSADPAQDRERADALRRSTKDAHEHAIVVEAITDVLQPYCRKLSVPRQPSLLRTASMWHLGTRISGELRDSGTSALELAVALHPTPAVCGWPTARAQAVIDETEPFDRGFYSGAVGWCDTNGDGEWAVALRCAEIAGDAARLFAGAGIVPGSDPGAELAETSAKLRTVLSALGIEEET